MIFDIDHFKKVNDTYGHQAGDAVIQGLAKVVSEQIRDTDIAGRYGGEEFVVLLPDVDCAGGRIFAERLRGVVERLQISHEGQVIPFTISLGVADLSEPSDDHLQLLQWADQALYTSKRNGRNQVTVFSN